MAFSDDEDYYTEAESCQSGGDDHGCSDDGEYNDYSDEDYVDYSSDHENDVITSSKAGADFVLETEEDVRARQEIAVAQITGLLSVPLGFAAALLRRCKWDPEQLQDEWFADTRRICDAVGLPVPADGSGVDVVVPTALNDRDLTCFICFESYGPGEMRSAAGCCHFYCHECWRGYVRAAVGDGPRCLSLRCPDADARCRAAVVRELVDAVADADTRERYARFAVRSFVEEGSKNAHVRWCPGPGCTRAVRSLVGPRLYEVRCATCAHRLCFRCGEDAHRPASCAAARAWTAKAGGSDGETASWVLANTKQCPACRRAIEKNQGCMHMTCGAPCGHEFCWLCLGPWKDHGGSFYACNRYEKDRTAAEGSTLTGAGARRRQGKEWLDRYLHYYERWTAYGDSQKKARADLDGLEAGGGLPNFADTLGVPVTEMDFITEAYAQIIESRRVLRWTYAHVYYMDDDDQEGDDEKNQKRRGFVEFIQGEAESVLEKLHCCAEVERKDLFCEAWISAVAHESGEEDYKLKLTFRKKFDDYKEKLSNLNLVMRHHFRKLVEGFEVGMADEVNSAHHHMKGLTVDASDGKKLEAAKTNKEPAEA